LVRLLSEEEPVRVKAAEVLGRIGAPAKSAAPALGNLLKGPQLEARIQAARALWRIDGRVDETVPVLVAALEHLVAPRQNNLLNLPGRFGIVSTAPPPSPGQEAAEALGQMGTAAQAAVPILRGLLKDSHVSAGHAYFALALEKIGS